MADTPRALRAVSDTLLRDLDALAQLEEEKRTTPLGDPRVMDLAKEIEVIARRVLTDARAQTGMTESVGAAHATQTIAATPRTAAAVLDEWRQLERRAAAAEPGSAEATELAILIERIRAEYRAVTAPDQPESSS